MLVTLAEMKDFLGEDGTAGDSVISDLITSAEEELEASTGIDILTTPKAETAKRAVRLMVWLSFYADRDAAKNTQYLITERDRLMTKLEYTGRTI